MNSYWNSDKIILSLSRAHRLKRENNLELFRLVENLAITAGLPTPRIYMIDSSSPNAFATGRNPQKAVICVTKGLVSKLNKNELQGVLAHEMSHIGNRDILLISVVITLVGIITLLSDWFLRISYFRDDSQDSGDLGLIVLVAAIIIAILAPFIATLIRLAISRQREYLADANAILLTRYPEGLISALQKISQDSTPLATATNTTSSLFIIDPLRKKRKHWFAKLWMTHPPVEDRIARLRKTEG